MIIESLSYDVDIKLSFRNVSNQVDAIVNTTSNDMKNLNVGAVSKAILQAGGPGIQKECDQYGVINDGDIVVTGGHNLQCQSVFHGHCPDWNGGSVESERVSTLFNC